MSWWCLDANNRHGGPISDTGSMESWEPRLPVRLPRWATVVPTASLCRCPRCLRFQPSRFVGPWERANDMRPAPCNTRSAGDCGFLNSLGYPRSKIRSWLSIESHGDLGIPILGNHHMSTYKHMLLIKLCLLKARSSKDSGFALI